MASWAGPLFYPPVGKIAVTRSGARIEVWPDESPEGCFTGLMLLEGRTHTQRVVLDLSCLWDKTQVVAIEEPTEFDKKLTGAAA